MPPADRDDPESDQGSAEVPTTNGGDPPVAEDGPNEEVTPSPEREEPRGIAWILRTDHPGVTFVREFLGSLLAVALVGLLLFAVSGVWPPMVAVESGSMEPHMYRGDLIFVMDEHRLAPDAAVMETGVVTYRSGEDAGYERFGSYGDVIIYRKNGGNGTPIIHRARFWVSDGENWYDRADPDYVRGDSCAAIPNCPAPHAGFITKGDNGVSNPTYDQVSGISSPVKPSWIKGTAEVRVPWLGHIRLQFSSVTANTSATPAA